MEIDAAHVWYSVHMDGQNKAPFSVLAKPIGPICNLRCDYCFYLTKEELFAHDSRSEYIMSDKVLEEFTRQYIEAQPEDCSEVTFAWQGGEPMMLPLDFYEKALSFQEKYRRPGMAVNNAIQTNGTLITRESAAWFAENNFLIGISIDGDEELHDRYRKDPKGRGSFSMVMQGLEHLKAAGAEFNTLTVVQNDNSEYPERVYNFLKSIESRYLQFIPIVEPLSGGRVSSRTVSPTQWGRFMNVVFDTWAVSDIGRIFVQHFDMMLGVHAGYPSSLCVHSPVCGRNPAIEHDGGLYSCDHFVTGETRLGSILENDLGSLANGLQQKEFGEAKTASLPGVCMKCKWRFICSGGCPKDRLVKLPDGNLNYLCEGYKAFYAHTAPYFQAMVQCLKQKTSPAFFRNFLENSIFNNAGRNDPCPCLSGRKYKQCHGKMS